MKYSIQTIVCGAYQENCYMLCPEGSSDALLIDPGDDLFALKRALSENGKTLKAILLTHGHFDHILSAEALSRITGAPVYVHEKDEELLCDDVKNGYNAMCSTQPSPTALVADFLEDTISISGISFKVLHTPGHTKGSVCFYDAENAALFSGDTLFCAGFGRMDFYGGSPASMRQSLRMLFNLPGNTRVYSGHGCETTIAAERQRYNL
ncbi:MAG: MBL fold metallo-hydrolase [Clostridia bacterium]|nr:MBL fold metallo-hydrolase [Clostridia bacterium]